MFRHSPVGGEVTEGTPLRRQKQSPGAHGWVISLGESRPGQPLYLRIVQAICEDIRRGRLRAGDPLPGSRSLARLLRLNRNTVVAAYDELVAEGWLVADRASRTRVSSGIPEVMLSPTPSVSGRLSPDRAAMSSEPADSLLNLSRADPDAATLPALALARAYRHSLLEASEDALRYGDPRGRPELRQAIADYLRVTRGVLCGTRQVMITRGSQMAFALLGELLPTGRRIAIEWLGYPPAWNALSRCGGELVPVPIDDAGMRVERLEDFHRERAIHAIYVTPHHQYPTTVTMSAGRRLELLDFAARTGAMVIEDDYDHEFAFGGRPVLPLASHPGGAEIAYVGTLSKVFAPGPRIGYLVADSARIDELARRRAIIDASGDPAIELAVAELFTSGEIRRHLYRARKVYAKRRERLVEEVGRRLAASVDYRVPLGGTALWLRARDGIDVDAWAESSAQRGIWFATGRRYAFGAQSYPGIRLNFASLSEMQIQDGVFAMAKALAQAP
jgi:GntR family transcriptional regulator / MocR family aminotransferase